MGTLYVIATPIGNLGDISFRAIETLKILDVLLCEDTRVTHRLLERYGLKLPLESYREQVHGKTLTRIVERLKQGQSIGLASDAGTPGISDPGTWLVNDLLRLAPETEMIPIPGPTAAIAALSVAGFPTEEFVFLGFPPHKKGRAAFFRKALAEPRTTVIYESTHRIVKALTAIAESAPNRRLCLARELTKIHETLYRGTAAEILTAMPADQIRGEFVLVLSAEKKRVDV